MIIYLDPIDELNTIVHRMRMVEDQEVVLVVPKENQALRDAINVKLLAKYAQDSHKQLAIQTQDPVIINNAEANGIPVIIDEAAAASEKESDTAEPKSKRHGRSPGGYERLFVILLVVAALLGLAYFNLPRAIIVVTPKVMSFQHELTLPLDQLSGLVKETASLTLTRRTPATGRKTVGIAAARGVVTLVNQTQSEILVKKGTIVETGTGIQFRTLSDVSVPAVKTQYFMDIPTGLTAGRAEVEIEAVDLGNKGNVAAGRITIIRGYDLEVRNMDPTSGGEDVVLHVATVEDIARVQAQVERDSRQELLNIIREQGDKRRMLEDTFQMGITWTQLSSEDTETNEVYATGICRGEVYFVDTDELSLHIAELLAASVPDGFMIKPESLVLEQMQLLTDDTGYQLRVVAQAMIQGVIDSQMLANELAGKDASEVEDILNTMPVIGEVAIDNGAADKLPQSPRWLRIKVEQPKPIY